MSPEDYRTMKALCYALPQLVAAIEQARMTMRKLRHLLFGAKTEQTDRVCPPAAPPPPPLIPPPPKPKRKGHGRIKAADYTGARWEQVPHPNLKPGCRCPACAQGTVTVMTRLKTWLQEKIAGKHVEPNSGLGQAIGDLLAIATHPAEVTACPSAWLPWNYPQAEIPAALHRDPPGHPG